MHSLYSAPSLLPQLFLLANIADTKVDALAWHFCLVCVCISVILFILVFTSTNANSNNIHQIILFEFRKADASEFKKLNFNFINLSDVIAQPSSFCKNRIFITPSYLNERVISLAHRMRFKKTKISKLSLRTSTSRVYAFINIFQTKKFSTEFSTVCTNFIETYGHLDEITVRTLNPLWFSLWNLYARRWKVFVILVFQLCISV